MNTARHGTANVYVELKFDRPDYMGIPSIFQIDINNI